MMSEFSGVCNNAKIWIRLVFIGLFFTGNDRSCSAFLPSVSMRPMNVVPTTSHHHQQTLFKTQQQYMSSSSNDDVEEKPVALIVKAEIEPNRVAEFLSFIEINAIESRKEPGCLRFDVVRCQEAPNQFFFYEIYKTMKDIDYHKQQKHFQLWADFKASGGTISSVTYKAECEFLS